MKYSFFFMFFICHFIFGQQKFSVGFDLGSGSSLTESSKNDKFAVYGINRMSNISYYRFGLLGNYYINPRTTIGMQFDLNHYNYRFRDKEISSLEPSVASYEFVNRLVVPSISLNVAYIYPLNDRVSLLGSFQTRFTFNPNSEGEDGYTYTRQILNFTSTQYYGSRYKTGDNMLFNAGPEFGFMYNLGSKTKLIFTYQYSFGFSDLVSGETYFSNRSTNAPTYLPKSKFTSNGNFNSFNIKMIKILEVNKRVQKIKPVVEKEIVQNEEQTIETKTPDNTEQPKEIELALNNQGKPSSLGGREVIKTNSVKMKNKDLVLKVWDNYKVDGDVISLFLNGEWLLENYYLEKKKKEIKIKLEPEKDNYLILYSISEGSLPSCTVQITIDDGSGEKTLNINANKRINGAIELKYNP
ncbi:MAG: hypothetical protein SNJ77_01910 [Cytophagales bacterium]